MVETKIVSKIKNSAVVKKKIAEEKLKENYKEKAYDGLKSFRTLFDEIDEIWEKYQAIYFVDNNYILYPDLMLLMTMDESIKVNTEELLRDFQSVIDNTVVNQKWEMSLLTETEVRTIFFEYSSRSRAFNYTQLLCRGNGEDEEYGFVIQNGRFFRITPSTLKYSSNLCSPGLINMKRALMMADINYFSSVRVPKGYRFKDNMYTNFQIIMEIGGIPVELKSKKLFKNLQDLVRRKIISVTDNGLDFTKKGITAIEVGECTQIGEVSIVNDAITEIMPQKNNRTIDISKMNSEDKAETLLYYSECDHIRANINLYDLAWLEDPNQGHWELWEGNEGDDLIELSPGNKIYARNPKSDIKGDCIVGIDFGTKSTVVVCQNESGMIRPMPIGNGDIRKELDSSDFENPTVMQFINFKTFL